MSEFLSVYITAPSQDEAQKIAQIVVEENLATCVNIFPGIQSIYRWQGKTERNNECAMIVKTAADKFDSLQKRVKEIHSHECPCIVAWPIVAGNAEYLS
jgi:periplasmic divalent cation tolerance protein